METEVHAGIVDENFASSMSDGYNNQLYVPLSTRQADEYVPRHLRPDPSPEVRYDLSTTEVKSSVSKFLADNAELPKGRLVGVKVESGDSMADVARWLECQVFKNSFQNGPAQMEELYREAEEDSTWFVVLDRKEKTPVGVMRIVDGDSAFKMTLAEAHKYIKMPEQIDDPVSLIRNHHEVRDGQRIWDAATMAIALKYRGKVFGQVAVAGMLQRMFIREATARGVHKVLTMLDTRAYGTLKMVSIPFETILGPQQAFPYAGSRATLAMIGELPEFQPSIAKRHAELSKESLIGNILRMGVKAALRRRLAGKVAGMAALGKNVDERIAINAPPIV